MNDRGLLLRWVRGLVHGTAAVGLLALLAQALLLVTDVLMRWLLSAPLLGVIDIYQLLNVIVIASFIPFVVFEQRNIKMQLFGGLHLPQLAAWADAFAHVCTLLFLSIAVWQCVRYAAHVSNQVTPILELPIAPVWWLGCALLSVCLPAQLAASALHLRNFGGGNPPAQNPPPQGEQG